jgi:hypothetical protein
MAKTKMSSPLSRTQILAWADAYHKRTGEWPTAQSGPVDTAATLTWGQVDSALYLGRHGLPGLSSLNGLLRRYHRIPSRRIARPLSVNQILLWADAHHRRTGRWPGRQSGRVLDAPRETWNSIDIDLRCGYRGLPSGSSIARLLFKHRGARTHRTQPPCTIDQILTWADAHRRRTGFWPRRKSGPIVDAPGETWSKVTDALREGRRGLPGGSSLARLLAEKRGVRRTQTRPALTEAQILQWAAAYCRRTNRWPSQLSGPVEERPDITWHTIDRSLRNGFRGLKGRSSLSRLLRSHRRRPNRRRLVQRDDRN